MCCLIVWLPVFVSWLLFQFYWIDLWSAVGAFFCFMLYHALVMVHKYIIIVIASPYLWFSDSSQPFPSLLPLSCWYRVLACFLETVHTSRHWLEVISLSFIPATIRNSTRDPDSWVIAELLTCIISQFQGVFKCNKKWIHIWNWSGTIIFYWSGYPV